MRERFARTLTTDVDDGRDVLASDVVHEPAEAIERSETHPIRSRGLVRRDSGPTELDDP